jgi:hypothetical protein
MSQRGFSRYSRTTCGLMLCISAASIAFVGASRAQTILQKEPGSGMLRSGETALVDDQSCPKGQIKEVTGGTDRKYIKDIKTAGTPRKRRCIPRP